MIIIFKQIGGNILIGYFPAPYKDEIMYSIFARYSHHSGIETKARVIKELINSNSVGMTPEFNRIKNLAKNVKHFSKEYSTEFFISNHTTIPLFRPFDSKLRTQKFDRPYFYKKSKVHAFRGDDVISKEKLYFCKSCLKEQFERLGEGYWDRLFQSPGVFVCDKHSEFLQIHSVNLVKDSNPQLIKPEETLLLMPEINIDTEIIDELANITENIRYFFENEIGFMESVKLYSKYMVLLKAKGIAIPKNKMKSKLGHLINKSFRDETLNLINSNPKTINWLEQFFYEKGASKMIHPVRHVILMLTLAGSVKNFLEGEFVFEPFGKGPWLCINPLSEHYLKKVVTNVEIGVYKSNRNRYQGDFICECGYMYRLMDNEQSPMELRFPNSRVVKRGHVWEKKMDELINNGVSAKKLSEITHLSVFPVYKIIKNMKEPLKNENDEKRKIKREQKTKDNRIKWEKLVKDNPGSTRYEISRLNRTAYTWLHEHDQEWLYENSPASQRGKVKSKLKIDDNKLLKKAKSVLANWSNEEENCGKLIWKTLTVISKKIGQTHLKEKSNSLPLTYDFVSRSTETIEEFEIRKCQKILNGKFREERVSKYSLTIEANLYRILKPAAEKCIDQLIETHNKKFETK